MSGYRDDDHYDHCDTVKLECGDEFCPDHDGYNKPLPEYAEGEPGSLLHKRGDCPACDSCWADVDANYLYDHGVTCPECNGGGVINVCANDGKAGCSHTNDREYPCHACNEEGRVRPDQVDLEGEFIPDDCECDGERSCRWPLHVMEAEQTAAYYAREFARRYVPPVLGMTYAEQMRDAGRGHLLTGDERDPWAPVPF